MVLVVKNLPANAGDVRDWGSILGSHTHVCFIQQTSFFFFFARLLYILTPPHSTPFLFRAVPQSHLRDCLLDLNLQHVCRIKHNYQLLGCEFFSVNIDIKLLLQSLMHSKCSCSYFCYCGTVWTYLGQDSESHPFHMIQNNTITLNAAVYSFIGYKILRSIENSTGK